MPFRVILLLFFHVDEGGRHGKTRSEIDWDSIMEAGGSGHGSTGAGKSRQEVKRDGSPHLSPVRNYLNDGNGV